MGSRSDCNRKRVKMRDLDSVFRSEGNSVISSLIKSTRKKLIRNFRKCGIFIYIYIYFNVPLGGKWFQLVQMAFGGGMISTCRFVEMGRGMVGFLFVLIFFCVCFVFLLLWVAGCSTLSGIHRLDFSVDHF